MNPMSWRTFTEYTLRSVIHKRLKSLKFYKLTLTQVHAIWSLFFTDLKSVNQY